MKLSVSCMILFSLAGRLSIAQHQNVLISNKYFPNEPAILINPKNTNEIIAGANIRNHYYSKDGGLTWTEDTAWSTYGVWGDPAFAVDTNGRFYYFHLSNPASGNWIDRIVCQTKDSIDGSFNNGSYMGLNGTKAQDKEWPVVDRKTNNIYVTWTQFDKYGSTNLADSSLILFSKSTDRGATWSAPIRISQEAGDCIDKDTTVEGATPAVGPNGEVYVAWTGKDGIKFDRSIDGGNTWLTNDIDVTSMPGGWEFSIPSWPRTNGLPVLKCDLSGGANHGNLYINWADQRNGLTDTDIWLTKSTDGGNNWSAPIRVNDDPPGKHQFLTWMDIDQTTGYLYFVFYDRRNYVSDTNDVYMAVSKDGGSTFTNFKVNTNSFRINSYTNFMGDYNNISAHAGVIRPIWTSNPSTGSEKKVWTAIIDTNALGIDHRENVFPISLEQNYPNPFKAETVINFQLKQASEVDLKIMDILGKEIATIYSRKLFNYGKHSITFDPGEYSLASGVYYVHLRSGKFVQTKKIILVE